MSDGGATVSGYMVTASGGGRTCSTSSALTCEVTGLTNGTAYTFTATATNSVGRSASSEASAPVTPAMVPGSVSIVEGTAGDGQVDLAWTSPAEHGSEIADYVVEYSTDGLAWTAFDDGISIMRGGPVTGLTNGTGYLFRVAAVNGVGMGVYSATFGPVTPRTVPTSPTSVVALARNGAARVSWAAPVSNGGLAITGYTVTADIGGSTCTTSGALTCDVEGLTNGTTYTFTVRAINEAGTGSPSIASEAMSPGAVPGSPTSVVAVAGDRSATVSWAPG